MQLSYEDSPVAVVGQVFRGSDVLLAVHRLGPDVVLLDINLPAPNGLDCARRLRQEFPAVWVVMLTMYAYPKFVEECRRLGVAGYLLKEERVETIVSALQRVGAGGTVFPKTAPAPNAHEGDEFVQRFKLTPTEVKLIGLLRRGWSSQEIAAQLFVSFDTVRSHRKNIYRKLGINHLSELVDFARENGL